MSFLRRLTSRFTQDEGERRAASIRDWASSVEGAVPIDRAEPRTVVRVAGVVESIRVRPRESSPVIEAILTDGTGRLTAVWLARRTIPGLTLGSRLVVEGRVGGGAGTLQIMNPRYEFAPAPHD